MKKILGLDLGTNSIGWALVKHDFENKKGEIIDMGARIIPMGQDVLDKFGSGQSISQTADRTQYRGVRRLLERNLLRRERLHRVLNKLNFLPEHYAKVIDFEKHKGQFKNGVEVKLNYRKNEEDKHEFIFMDSFNEMLEDFKDSQPDLLIDKKGNPCKIPLDWTLYYLRKKALTNKISKEELTWILLNFNQKRGYYQLRGKENKKEEKGKITEVFDERVVNVEKGKNDIYKITLSDGTVYEEKSTFQITFINDIREVEIVSEEKFDKKTKSTELKLSKKVKFLKTLNVVDVIDTGEIDSKELKTFKVFLENGNELTKKKKTEIDWKGKPKTVLISVEIKNKNKTFITAPEETSWTLVKKKTEQDLNQSGLHLCEFIYNSLLKEPKQKIRGQLIKTIERKYYKEEITAILKEQIKHHPELQNDEIYNICIEELYPLNEAHRKNLSGKGFLHLFVEDILFYQRPLKSKKSTISDCPYEKRCFIRIKDGKKEEQKEAIKCISKSNPYFQEFRLWQFIRNLKIYEREGEQNGKTIIDMEVTHLYLKTEDDWINLFDFLNKRKEIDQKAFLKHFKLNDKSHRWNNVEDRKYPCNENKAQFISRLQKLEGVNAQEFLTRENELALWHIIYSVKDKTEFESALAKFAIKNELAKEPFVESFKKFPPFPNEYGAYSEKAIKKLLPLMQIGKYWNENNICEQTKQRVYDIIERLEAINYDEKRIGDNSDDAVPKQLMKSFIAFKDKNPLQGLNTYQACYAVYGRHSEVSDIQIWKSPKQIDEYLKKFKQHSLRNPIVEQVITETLRVVRDIWQHRGNGDKDFFDEIHVELGRDMKNTAEKRKRISEQQSENENTNQRIRALLQELKDDSRVNGDVRPYSPSQQEILKIFEDGVVNSVEKLEDDIVKIRKSPSPTKKEIERYKIWLEQKYVSPYTGLTIRLTDLFTEKYQIEHIIPKSRYFDDSLQNKVICESEVNELKSNMTAYEFIKKCGGQLVAISGRGNKPILRLTEYENHCKGYFKQSPGKLKFLLSEEVPEGFINRQLNDSRYISKIVKNLLGNIVREEGEQEATPKNLIPVTGAITSVMKQDWGLNDKWNEIITPRFKRLNEMTDSNDFGYQDNNIFRTDVPEDLKKGFSKKRIDHRHHTLDALIVACVTREHTNYITTLSHGNRDFSREDKLRKKEDVKIPNHETGEDEIKKVAKEYLKPWEGFPAEAKEHLEKTVVSFKQNLRVINKTNNLYQKWEKDKEGNLKKVNTKQEKGDNWAIRKSLHKDTISGSVCIKREKSGMANLNSYIENWHLIVDKKIRRKVREIVKLFSNDYAEVKKHLKKYPIEVEGEKVQKIKVYEFVEATATRGISTPLTEKFTRKQLEAVTDSGIRKIFENHIKNYIDEDGKERFDLAFNPDGLDDLNKNIVVLNNGKFHHPIYKVRLYEVGNKFEVGETGINNNKFVEAAKGTNLFFAIYWDEEKQKRVYETVPLNEIITHQKQVANLPKEERTIIPIKQEKGQFLFTLSPNDLVYVPTDDEMENPEMVNFDNLSTEQTKRIYKTVSSTGNQCFFINANVASAIKNKYEFSSLNKMEKSIDGEMIKDRCWKLKTDRLGKIIEVVKRIPETILY